MAAEGQSDKMMSDMKVRMKQKRVTEFLLMGKNGIDIHQCECELSEVVGGALQQLQQRRWFSSTGADFLQVGHAGSCSLLVKMHRSQW